MSTETKLKPAVGRPAKSKASRPSASFFRDPLRLTSILAPLDLSPESLRALDFAWPLARRFGASLHYLHVYEGAHQFATIATSPLLWPEKEGGRHLADEVELTFGTRPPKADCHLRIGDPVREIIATAGQLNADLVVMAAHGKGSLRHLLLGSTTEKIIRAANCPILIMREASRGPVRTSRDGIVLQKILVPVDFSDCALEGARYASVFAAAVGADFLLMHVVRPLSHQVTESKGAPKHWSPELKDSVLDAEDKLDALVNFLPLSGIEAETEVGVGVPAEQLTIASARPEVDLVVLSTHGYSGLRHALLDSVAEELSREAGCPVLILPSHLRADPKEVAKVSNE